MRFLLFFGTYPALVGELKLSECVVEVACVLL